MSYSKKIKKLFAQSNVTVNNKVDDRIIADSLTALNNSENTKPLSTEHVVWRTIMKNPITKYATVAAIIIVVLTVVFQFGGSMESLAFAEAVQPVLDARTASFDVALESGNQPIQKSHFLCMSPGLVRQTISQGIINIVDYGQNKTLHLNPNTMTAKITTLVLRQNSGVPDILGQMQQRIRQAMSLSNDSVEYLDRRFINDQEAVGFRVQLNGEQNYVIGWQGRGTFTVWADTKTKQPIQLEWYDEALDINTIATNIKLNVDTNESMFSMEIPEGYISSEEIEETPEFEVPLTVDEQKIISNLKDWVKLSGGTFPSSVIGYSAIKDLDPNADISFIQKEWKGFDGYVHVNLLSIEDFLKVMQLIASGGLIGKMPPGSDWHYAGKGVKLGDANTAIFWYKPRDSKNYRVIYGDLSVKDAAPEELPKLN
jgi:outer membrane lipoprotein-sorting protein